MSKDTIYREDAIEAVEELNAISFYELNEHSKEAFVEIRRALKALPSADRPQGEWIEMYRDGFGNMICMCSKCSFHASRSRYCPNCGAEMARSRR